MKRDPMHRRMALATLVGAIMTAAGLAADRGLLWTAAAVFAFAMLLLIFAPILTGDWDAELEGWDARGQGEES